MYSYNMKVEWGLYMGLYGIIMDPCGLLWIGIYPVNVDRKLWKIMGSHHAI